MVMLKLGGKYEQIIWMCADQYVYIVLFMMVGQIDKVFINIPEYYQAQALVMTQPNNNLHWYIIEIVNTFVWQHYID